MHSLAILPLTLSRRRSEDARSFLATVRPIEPEPPAEKPLMADWGNDSAIRIVREDRRWRLSALSGGSRGKSNRKVRNAADISRWPDLMSRSLVRRSEERRSFCEEGALRARLSSVDSSQAENPSSTSPEDHR